MPKLPSKLARAPKSATRIATFDYLRKSTAGQKTVNGQRKEKQEKSIEAQREELDSLRFPDQCERAGYSSFEVVGTFSDVGVSGWKLGKKRPGFYDMMKAIHAHPAKEKAIRVDNLDRFSRADIDETQEVVRTLAKSGVRYIISAAQGVFDLGRSGKDLGEALRLTIAIHLCNEYSRQLSRHITRARRNGADDGRRTGGKAPYAFKDDHKGGLKLGDRNRVQIVKWIFETFVKGSSINAIAGDLNRRKVPAPAGGQRWHSRTIAAMLRNPVFKGAFEFNMKPAGRFFGINGEGEVVENERDQNGKLILGDRKRYRFEKRYPAIVAPALWEKAQKRLEKISKTRSLRKRSYALSGILRCGHCGTSLCGWKSKNYRCNGNSLHGKKTCEHRTVREDLLLPFIVRVLGKEISEVRRTLSDRMTLPPDELVNPNTERKEQRERAEQEKARLNARIAGGVERMLDEPDARIRDDMRKLIDDWRAELKQVETQLQSVDIASSKISYKKIDELLNKFWDNFHSKAVSVPVSLEVNLAMGGGLCQDRESEESAVLLHPMAVNELLLELGSEITVFWETRMLKTRAGNLVPRRDVSGGRFRVGRQTGDLRDFLLPTASQS